MPAINLLMPDSSSYFNTALLPNGKATLLFYYQLYCEACGAEWQSIAANMDKLRDIQFCLVTDHPNNDMTAFYKHYNLKRYSNVVAGRDTAYAFMRLYKPEATPYHVFCDKGKRYRGGGAMVLIFTSLIH